jgi:hypothetical protein
VQLLTTGEACKKFLKLTKRWTKPILVRSLRDRPQLYWHATLNSKVHTPLTPLLSHRAPRMPAKGSPAYLSCAQMAPATTPAKLESPDAEPAVDDKAVCVPVKPEAPRDDELSIQSLPQGTMAM